MPSFTRLLAIVGAIAGLIAPTLAMNCPRGGVSNTTAVRKTYPVPPIEIYPFVGDFFNTSWSTIFSFNYTGETHRETPGNSSQLAAPNATRIVSFQGYEFEESLFFINDTAPMEMFQMKWNLTNPPVKKPYIGLTIDAYIQDFKFTSSCAGNASLMEWTVEYCASDQDEAWNLFQNKTSIEADNLAVSLDVPGAADGTWDVGCALPVTTTSTSTATSMEPTATDGSETSTASSAAKTSSSKNAAMPTVMPKMGGAIALFAAAAVLL